VVRLAGYPPQKTPSTAETNRWARKSDLSLRANFSTSPRIAEIKHTCAEFSTPARRGLLVALRKLSRTKRGWAHSKASDWAVGTPFLMSHWHLLNSVPEYPKKPHSGTNGQVDRWPRPTSDPRRCIPGDTEFHEKQTPAMARSHRDRYTKSVHEREQGLDRTCGIVGNSVDEWKQ